MSFYLKFQLLTSIYLIEHLEKMCFVTVHYNFTNNLAFFSTYEIFQPFNTFIHDFAYFGMLSHMIFLICFYYTFDMFNVIFIIHLTCLLLFYLKFHLSNVILFEITPVY